MMGDLTHSPTLRQSPSTAGIDSGDVSPRKLRFLAKMMGNQFKSLLERPMIKRDLDYTPQDSPKDSQS